ncbi:MAG: trehalose-phosphatase [Calditrichota bacterium]
MQILNAEFDVEHFYQELKGALHKILFLDYDGTLAPFREDPETAYPYPGIRKALDKLMENDNIHVYIISGRWTRDLIPLLKLNKQPEIWGSHGLERLRPDGTYEIAHMDESARQGLAEGQDILSINGFFDLGELKPGCVALHWRGLNSNEIEQIKTAVEPEWINISEKYGLELQNFDGGLELRVPGRNKGDAVDTVLTEFNGEYVASYLGDDLTDEDAFRALKERGLSVLVRNELRETSADIWVRPPEELIDFLLKWI